MFTALCLLPLLSCTKDIGRKKVDCIIPETVSFSKDIAPLFTANCSTSGCHSGNNPAGNLNLEASVAYAQLHKNGSGYIDTVNPKFSLLYSQMVSVNTPMPPTGKLDDCKLNTVLKWLEQKAKNN